MRLPQSRSLFVQSNVPLSLLWSHTFLGKLILEPLNFPFKPASLDLGLRFSVGEFLAQVLKFALSIILSQDGLPGTLL